MEQRKAKERTILYYCDPTRNTKRSMSGCIIYGGRCCSTQDIDCAGRRQTKLEENMLKRACEG